MSKINRDHACPDRTFRLETDVCTFTQLICSQSICKILILERMNCTALLKLLNRGSFGFRAQFFDFVEICRTSSCYHNEQCTQIESSAGDR